MKLALKLVNRLVELLFRLLKLNENPEDSDLFLDGFISSPSRVSFMESTEGDVGMVVGEYGHEPMCWCCGTVVSSFKGRIESAESVEWKKFVLEVLS